MRVLVALSAACILSSAPLAFAQEWTELVSREDGFRVHFPAQPTITQTTYTSEYGADLPAHLYSVVRGGERYSMTVVDYSPIEKS
jgi:hypothetical protein